MTPTATATETETGNDYQSRLDRFTPMAEDRLWQILMTGTNGSQSESILNLKMGNYVALARSDAALANLIGLLDGSMRVPGLSVQADLRWRIIQRLAARGHASAVSLLAAERQRDTSDAGHIAAIAAEAALPDHAIKQQWVEHLLDNSESLPFSNLRAAMSALFPVGQADLQLTLLPQLTSSLGELASGRDAYFLQSFGRDLFDGVCDSAGLQLLQSALEVPAAIGPTLYKFISENVQRAENCVAYVEAN